MRILFFLSICWDRISIASSPAYLWKQLHRTALWQIASYSSLSYIYPHISVPWVPGKRNCSNRGGFVSASYLLAWAEFWFRKTSACGLTEQRADLTGSVDRARSFFLLVNWQGQKNSPLFAQCAQNNRSFLLSALRIPYDSSRDKLLALPSTVEVLVWFLS